MFHSSHLDSGSLGADPILSDTPPEAGLSPSSVPEVASVPAPVPTGNALITKILMVGGIALLVYLVLQQFNKKKS